jgi:2-keto-4-pentenoate hydratase/2-oxohepta-3-ene-1,7-dioic acid hydratase in catechol pathway
LGSVRIDGHAAAIIAFDGAIYRLADVLSKAGSAAAGALEVLDLLEEWERWRVELPALVKRAKEAGLPAPFDAASLDWLAPVVFPRKVICVGTNYWDHIEEMKVPTKPTYPYAFLKPPSTTLVGTGTPVVIPAQSAMTDWEAELAVVIGARVRNVPASRALDCVAGYSAFNDVSARDWIESRPAVGMDWILHKCFDGFAPMGPFLTPAEFVAHPDNLAITLTVDGVLKQSSNTGKMIFSVAECIAHLSSVMTLEPGDVIATGTPAGVGYARSPREFLKPGSVMVVEIEELGRLVTPMVAPG